MKKVILKLMLVVALFIAIDRGAGLLLDSIRNHSPDGRYYKTNYSLFECREDVLVIGSSRGEINIVSQVVEDSLRLSCWNAGRGGQALPYFRAIQEAVLSRYVPKIAILHVDDNLLEFPVRYERVGFLRPYYDDCAPIRPVLNKISSVEPILLKSRLYAYNSSYYYLLRPYLLQNLDGRISDKGWKPRLNKMDVELGKTLEVIDAAAPLDPVAVAEFDTLVNKFMAKNCLPIFVVAPNYGRSVSASATILYLKKRSAELNIPLYIFSDNPDYVSNAALFVDPDHLNTDGAHRFTSEIMRRIKPELQRAHPEIFSTRETISEAH